MCVNTCVHNHVYQERGTRGLLLMLLLLLIVVVVIVVVINKAKPERGNDSERPMKYL